MELVVFAVAVALEGALVEAASLSDDAVFVAVVEIAEGVIAACPSVVLSVMVTLV